MTDIEIWRWLQEGYLVTMDEADQIRCTIVVEPHPDGTFTVIKEEFSRVVTK